MKVYVKSCTTLSFASMPCLPVTCQMYLENSGEFDPCVPSCRANGQRCDKSMRPCNPGPACCPCLSHRSRPATASPMDDRRETVRRERMAQGEDGTRTCGLFGRAPAACAAHRTPAWRSGRVPIPPARLAIHGVCAGSAARPSGLRPRPRTPRQTRRVCQELGLWCPSPHSAYGSHRLR